VGGCHSKHIKNTPPTFLLILFALRASFKQQSCCLAMLGWHFFQIKYNLTIKKAPIDKVNWGFKDGYDLVIKNYRNNITLNVIFVLLKITHRLAECIFTERVA
jgi:hypothetical protein